MKQKDLFSAKFNERDFRKFIAGLLPDFQEEHRPITVRGAVARRILQNMRMLGESETCQLTVIVVQLNRENSKKRILVTQETFRILRQHRIRNAMVVFLSDDDKWRLSLLTSTLEIKNGKVIGRTSNPRRYSYLLGPNTKTKTPRKFLLESGAVTNLEELKERFSVEVVNKQFYNAIVVQFIKLIGGERGEGRAHQVYEPQLTMPDKSEMAEFAVRLVGRIIFCWFLKEKRSAAGQNLIPDSLVSSSAARRHPNYYHNVLEPVFFECLDMKFEQRAETYQQTPFSQVPYLNGGLFSPQANDFYHGSRQVEIPDEWFVEIFEILEQYNFTVDENTNLDVDLSIDPEMLGRIFENLLAEINPETGESARKATGSFYTPREIVTYMVRKEIREFLDRETSVEKEKLEAVMDYERARDLTLTKAEREEIVEALARLKILDPACGSGAFPMGVLQIVFYILQQVDPKCEMWYEKQTERRTMGSVMKDLQDKFQDDNYDYIRKLGIIQQTIFGVDVQPIATELTKLRCFLTLVIEEKVDDTKPNRGIHPLPNLDFKFITANALKFLPENPNDPFNMFETGASVDLVRKIRTDYFMADKAGRTFLKAEFDEAQHEISETEQELAKLRYQNLAEWRPFLNQQTEWFDSEWMFGVRDFDIVIGNPPYGTVATKDEQDYYMKNYKSARSEDGTQGSLDTSSLFVERGLDLLKTGGSLAFIAPMAVTSNETMAALQNELEQKCETMRIASFTNRPRQIFDNACVRNSIIFCQKTNTPIKKLYMTRPVRRGSEMTIQEVIDGLEFVEAYKYKMLGRYPKVSNVREVKILEKIFQSEKCVQDYASASSGEFYYRAAGGRYFNIVTLEATGTSAERKYRAEYATLIAACLSTSLFWFYQQVYTDGLNLKGYEVDKFPLPDFEKIPKEILTRIEETYLRYLENIERNANTKNVAKDSRYNVQQFKEYKLVKSKNLIDELDDLIDPLYGLSTEEVEYIKRHEEEVRVGDRG